MTSPATWYLSLLTNRFTLSTGPHPGSAATGRAAVQELEWAAKWWLLGTSERMPLCRAPTMPFCHRLAVCSRPNIVLRSAPWNGGLVIVERSPLHRGTVVERCRACVERGSQARETGVDQDLGTGPRGCGTVRSDWHAQARASFAPRGSRAGIGCPETAVVRRGCDHPGVACTPSAPAGANNPPSTFRPAKPGVLVERMVNGIATDFGFGDAVRLLNGLGLVEVRTSGSHHIHASSGIPGQINLQSHRDQAKQYQLRQLAFRVGGYDLVIGEQP